LILRVTVAVPPTTTVTGLPTIVADTPAGAMGTAPAEESRAVETLTVPAKPLMDLTVTGTSRTMLGLTRFGPGGTDRETRACAEAAVALRTSAAAMVPN
jgi:hypothetical protein